ncbi:MAG: Xaa-Pro peptidase family protein [Candidatus Peregrinibacteria bacterium]|nr:Xaa-Pro peptidase family protein [Candidatus Peregrinibacteria bacterium]
MRPRTPQPLLRSAGTQAFLVSDLTNVRYLTGMALTAGIVLLAGRRQTLITDARYTERAQRTLPEGWTVADGAETQALLKPLRECGIESETVTVQRLRLWKRKFPNTKFVQTEGVVAEFRRAKEESELKQIRRAHKITVELLRRVPSALRKGITEEQVARKLKIWALELGADGLAFDPIVAFGTHTSSPHHAPTSRALQKGHIVQIDVGAQVQGYCADRSEVYFTTRPTAEEERMYRALTEAKEAAKSLVRAGVNTRALDRKAREVLRQYGIENAFTHSLGHGVGLEIHEGVSLSEKAPDRKLLAGEVITIEPGVYFPGKFGMRLEDMVIVR